jgi:hypothetical protein
MIDYFIIKANFIIKREFYYIVYLPHVPHAKLKRTTKKVGLKKFLQPL